MIFVHRATLHNSPLCSQLRSPLFIPLFIPAVQPAVQRKRAVAAVILAQARERNEDLARVGDGRFLALWDLRGEALPRGRGETARSVGRKAHVEGATRG